MGRSKHGTAAEIKHRDDHIAHLERLVMHLVQQVADLECGRDKQRSDSVAIKALEHAASHAHDAGDRIAAAKVLLQHGH